MNELSIYCISYLLYIYLILVDPLTGRSGPSAGKHELLIQLLDFTIGQYYPDIWKQHSESKERYHAWYRYI